MATSSPSGWRRCPSERAGGALSGEGPGGKRGRRRPRLPRPRPPPPGAAAPGRPAPAPTCEGHGPRATTAHGRATSAARLLFPDRPQARPACLAGPARSRGTQSVPANTLRRARRPRKCGPAAKPRPAPPRPCLWELSGGARGLARCPAGPRRGHQPRAAAATPRSPLCPSLRVGTWPHDGRGVCGAAPSLTLGGPASRVLGPIGDRLCRLEPAG